MGVAAVRAYLLSSNPSPPSTPDLTPLDKPQELATKSQPYLIEWNQSSRAEPTLLTLQPGFSHYQGCRR